MKAIVCHKYGGPEVLQLEEVPTPQPNDNEVLVKVHAASVNDWDWGIITGLPKFYRIFSGFNKPKTKIVGSDIAGTIEAIGKNITKFKEGDEVFGDLSGTWGGFAEYVCAKEKALAIKPKAMSFIEAAAIPQAAMLAVQGLIDVGNIQPNQKVLINGAGGGVGTYGVRIAKEFNAEVTGVDKASKFDTMRSVGFDHLIDYTKEDFTNTGKRYDLILDAKTNRPLSHYARALNPKGTYATVGGDLSKLLRTLVTKPWLRITTGMKFSIVVLKPNKDLDYTIKLFEAGKIKSVIDGPYRLEEVPRAFEIFANGDHKGKMVISL